MGHALPRQVPLPTTARQPSVRTGRMPAMSAGTRTRSQTSPRSQTVNRQQGTTQQAIRRQPTGRQGIPTGGRTRVNTPATANNQLTVAQTIAGVDRLNANTPNYEIERLLMAIDRFRRSGVRLPATNAYRGNWEWVQFEITRRLKRALKERDDLLIRMNRTFVQEITALQRATVRSARRPQQTQTQTQTHAGQGNKRGQVAKLRTVAA